MKTLHIAVATALLGIGSTAIACDGCLPISSSPAAVGNLTSSSSASVSTNAASGGTNGAGSSYQFAGSASGNITGIQSSIDRQSDTTTVTTSTMSNGGAATLNIGRTFGDATGGSTALANQGSVASVSATEQVSDHAGNNGCANTSSRTSGNVGATSFVMQGSAAGGSVDNNGFSSQWTFTRSDNTSQSSVKADADSSYSNPIRTSSVNLGGSTFTNGHSSVQSGGLVLGSADGGSGALAAQSGLACVEADGKAQANQNISGGSKLKSTGSANLSGISFTAGGSVAGGLNTHFGWSGQSSDSASRGTANVTLEVDQEDQTVITTDTSTQASESNASHFAIGSSVAGGFGFSNANANAETSGSLKLK